jgi:predicted nucleic acid-binding protein
VNGVGPISDEPVMRAIVLDTDVASQSFKRRPAPILTRLIGFDPVITFVTRAELTKWAEVHGWGPHNRDRLAHWLSSMPMLPGVDQVADVWGVLAAAASKRGRPRPQNDMWIAASCLAYGLPLATLNVKDYEDFAAYHGLQMITG